MVTLTCIVWPMSTVTGDANEVAARFGTVCTVTGMDNSGTAFITPIPASVARACTLKFEMPAEFALYVHSNTTDEPTGTDAGFPAMTDGPEINDTDPGVPYLNSRLGIGCTFKAGAMPKPVFVRVSLILTCYPTVSVVWLIHIEDESAAEDSIFVVAPVTADVTVFPVLGSVPIALLLNVILPSP